MRRLRGALGRVAALPVATLVATLVAGAPTLRAEERASGDSRGPAPAWTCHDEVCQRATRRGEALSLELQNRRDRATWVVLEPFDLSNVRPLAPPPYLVALGPGETRAAGILAIEDTARAYAYQARWRALTGNPNAVHDDRWQYRMPFGGSSGVRISQAYDGPYTHVGLGAYALDFPMPAGTPILAARSGTVAEVVEGSASDGRPDGTDSRPGSGSDSGEGGATGDNHVLIEHADGTFAMYAHLRHGQSIRIGERVETGDRIGLSGDTGAASGPHLHFEVFKIRLDGRRQTIPVRFWNGSPKGITPLAGVEYAPGCPRSGGGACRPGVLPTEDAVPAAPDSTSP